LLVLTIEHAAASLTWLGIHQPVIAWTVVGAVLGGYLGMLYGRYRSGRLPTIYWSTGGGILLLGLLAVPVLRYGMAPVEAPGAEAPKVAYSAYVTVQTLNVRASPTIQDGNVVGTVDCGAEVRVISGSGPQRGSDWLHIADAQGQPWGYVAQQYTRRAASTALDCSSSGSSRDPSGTVAEQRAPQLRTPAGEEVEREAASRSEQGTSPEAEQPQSPSAPDAQDETGAGNVSTDKRPSGEPPEETRRDSRAGSQVRYLSPQTKETAQFQIQVSQGIVRPTEAGTEVKLQVRQTSTDFEGTWYPWAFIVRNCAFVDAEGRQFRLVPERSTGPEATRATVGSSRIGTMVFEGPLVSPDQTAFTFTFGYYIDKDLDFTLRLPN